MHEEHKGILSSQQLRSLAGYDTWLKRTEPFKVGILCRYGFRQAITFFDLVNTAFEELENMDDHLHFAISKAFLQHMLDLPGKPHINVLRLATAL